MSLNKDEIINKVETDSRKDVDDSIKENASVAENTGLEIRVSRRYDGIGIHGGKDCQWCLGRCGENMTLQEALEKGAFQRHTGCGCEIEYTSAKGVTRVQSWAGGRESWIKEEELDNRKSYGLNKDEGPSRKELVHRMIKGQDDPNNQGVIAERLLTKRYSLEQRHQKFLQHKKGTAQYKNTTRDRGREQSFLYITEKEAQDIIFNCAGKGIIDLDKNGLILDYEYIELDRFVGEYYEKGGWHKTCKIKLMHSKRGAHIVPIKNK